MSYLIVWPKISFLRVWILTSHVFFQFMLLQHVHSWSQWVKGVPTGAQRSPECDTYSFLSHCWKVSSIFPLFSVLLTPAMMLIPCLWSLGIKSLKCPWWQIKLAVQWDPCSVPCKSMPHLGTKIFSEPRSYRDRKYKVSSGSLEMVAFIPGPMYSSWG